jgi:hypothetical protein
MPRNQVVARQIVEMLSKFESVDERVVTCTIDVD